MSDADHLEIKKRARRRLVGAAALALLAAIVLPMTMDQEPYPVGKDIQITIPDRDAGTGKQRAPEGAGRGNPVTPVVPVPEEQAPEEAGPEADLAAPAVPLAPAAPAAAPPARPPAPAAAATPPVSPPAPSPASPAEVRPRPAPLPAVPVVTPPLAAQDAAGTYTLQIGAFANAANADRIAAKLQQQGLPAYTEKVGNMTRVRVGPFAARAAADKAAAQLKALGHGAVPSPR